MFLVMDEAFKYLSTQCPFAYFKRGHPDKNLLFVGGFI